MKSIKFNSLLLITFVVFTSVFTSCKKDYEASKPTFLPNISIIGEKTIVVIKGDAYNEPGATATENGNEIDFAVSGKFDVTTEGAYVLTYTATNQDGFTATDSRIVAIIDTNGLANVDLSSSFTRQGQTGSSVTWTKHPTLPYTYIANNPGGVPPSSSAFAAHDAAIYNVFNVAEGIVSVPLQSTATLSPFFCQSAAGSLLIPFNVAAAPGDVSFEWAIIGVNFGPAPRIFKKL